MSEVSKKIYELGYHVLPNLSEEELAKVVEGIKKNLEKFKAEIISEEYPKMMNLAYEITKDIDNKNRKFGSAFFGFIKFEIETANIEELNSIIEKNVNILRFLLIKTVRENTLAGIKIAHKNTSKRHFVEAEAPSPMDEVEVDKKIDEMVDADLTDVDLK